MSVMSEDISARNVVKFNGTNFQTWKFQMLQLFFAHGIQDVVDGTREMPENQDGVEAKAWVRDNAKASFLISTSVESSRLEPLLVCKTTKMIWDKLCLLHEQKSEANKMSLLQKFHEYRMSPGDSIEQHIGKVQNMAAGLNDLGEPISDNVLVSKLLASLPTKYSTFRMVWDAMEPARQTLENLQTRLIREEAALSTTMDDGASALAVSKQDHKKKNAGDKKKKRLKKNIECYKCHEMGHFARECKNKRQEGEPEDKDLCDVAFIGVRNKELETEKCSTLQHQSVRELQDTDQREVWLTDSGASAHMTFRREWLTEYRKDPHNGTVVLGDNKECDVADIGTVNIKKFSNGAWEKSKIENVLYVPKLKKKLVFGWSLRGERLQNRV